MGRFFFTVIMFLLSQNGNRLYGNTVYTVRRYGSQGFHGEMTTKPCVTPESFCPDVHGIGTLRVEQEQALIGELPIGNGVVMMAE